MLLRPFLKDSTSCGSYLFGCGTQANLPLVSQVGSVRWAAEATTCV